MPSSLPPILPHLHFPPLTLLAIPFLSLMIGIVPAATPRAVAATQPAAAHPAGGAAPAADTALFTLQSWPPSLTGAGRKAETGGPSAEALESADPASDEDILSAYGQVRSASFAGWSPSGIHILTRMGPHPQLYSLSAPLADRRQETFFRRRVDQWNANPVPARRQVLIALDQGGDEDFSLRLLDLRNGRTRALACPPGRVTSVLWNDSGTAFLYSHTPPGTDRWDIRRGVPPGVDAPAADSGRDTLLLSRPGTWTPMDWAPDGSRAVVQRYVSASVSELHILSVPEGLVTRLLPDDPPQYFDHACWVRLPETGRTLGLAFTSDRDGANHRLYLLRDGEGKPTALTPPAAWDVEWAAAGGDRRTVVYSVNEQGVSVLHALKPGITPLSSVRLAGIPKGIIEGVTFNSSGKEFGFTVNGAAFPGEAFTYRLGGRKATRWTESETAGLPRESFREPELILYPTFDSVAGPGPAPRAGPPGKAEAGADAGKVPRKISAWLYTPDTGGASKGPWPVLISIHGGPELQARAGFDPFVQYLAGRMKVAVLLPNVRGSTGYGKDYLKADDGMLRTGAVKDIGALLDWIATRPDLDPRRVAVTGRSYGGFMSLATLIQYGDRLRGGASTVGITHFPSFLKETSGYRRDLRRAEYGDERDPRMAAFLDSISPVRNLDRLKRPLLLAHGRNDPRVPYAESVRLFDALKARQVPVWLLTFNKEGHAFRSEDSQLAYSRVMADFLAQQFLLPTPP